MRQPKGVRLRMVDIRIPNVSSDNCIIDGTHSPLAILVYLLQNPL